MLPAIYGIRPVLDSDTLETWIDRSHIDNFDLIHPKTWDATLKADHKHNYNFMHFIIPNHNFLENKAIPLFSLNTLWRKTCQDLLIKHWKKHVYTEANGLGEMH